METLKILLLVFVAMSIGALLDEHRKKRLGIKDKPKEEPSKPPKSKWPTDEMYKNFYRTGDRRFLYDEHYKKKGYNDYDSVDYDDDDYEDDDFDDKPKKRKKRKKRKTKHYTNSWVSDENYEKFLRTGDRNYLWDENYRRWDDYDDDYEETDDYSDDFDAEDRECDRVLKEVKEFLDKDKPKLILPDSYIMEQQQRNARRRTPKP